MALPAVPTTAAMLEAMLHDEVLTESVSFDAKARISDGAKGNRALAIDLAAMAVAGGLIVVGIAEEKARPARQSGRRLQGSPVPLAGVRERASQVGLSRVDPPLTVLTRELPTDAAGNGYLLILVPPSPDAPHMVDGQYRGRGDTTNYVMGDAEVRRIQAQRRVERPDIGRELQRAIERDPTAADSRRHAHLFVVAVPTVPTDRRMLQRQLPMNWQNWLHEQITRQPSSGRFGPDLSGGGRIVRRPSGCAWTGFGLNEMRQAADDYREADLLELEVDEDGALRLFCGRASDSPTGEEARFAIEPLIPGLTWRVLRMAEAIATTSGYVGNWDVGVALTNARGIASYELGRRTFRAAAIPYAEDEYREVTQATHAEITTNRHAVVERLIGRLNRALNDDVIPLHNFDAAG